MLPPLEPQGTAALASRASWRDAEARNFDVVLAESMSRIGRDQEDRAFVRKRLKFFQIGLETPSEGEVNAIWCEHGASSSRI
jgi:hypothetical protein